MKHLLKSVGKLIKKIINAIIRIIKSIIKALMKNKFLLVLLIVILIIVVAIVYFPASALAVALKLAGAKIAAFFASIPGVSGITSFVKNNYGKLATAATSVGTFVANNAKTIAAGAVLAYALANKKWLLLAGAALILFKVKGQQFNNNKISLHDDSSDKQAYKHVRDNKDLEIANKRMNVVNDNVQKPVQTQFVF